ncbi:MAG: FISUMP domain-containing protein [Chitinophagaceae bacterium]
MNFCYIQQSSQAANSSLRTVNGWQGTYTSTNESGFFAIPGGRCLPNGTFEYIDEVAYWWNSTRVDAAMAWSTSMSGGLRGVFDNYSLTACGFSLRCIKD